MMRKLWRKRAREMFVMWLKGISFLNTVQTPDQKSAGRLCLTERSRMGRYLHSSPSPADEDRLCERGRCSVSKRRSETGHDTGFRKKTA